MKCEYCQKEITGSRFRRHRYSRFEILCSSSDPKDFIPKDDYICKDCMEEMGFKLS